MVCIWPASCKGILPEPVSDLTSLPGVPNFTGMTATLEQTQTDLTRLLELVQRGEEIVITRQGRPVAKLTGWPVPKPISGEEKSQWLEELAELRGRVATGKSHPKVEELLDEDRGN